MRTGKSRAFSKDTASTLHLHKDLAGTWNGKGVDPIRAVIESEILSFDETTRLDIRRRRGHCAGLSPRGSGRLSASAQNDAAVRNR
jgi:hypothetical protein